MKNDCKQWKSQLLEAALAGTVPGVLREHLSNCSPCAAELATLRVKRDRLDALLPLVAQGAEPSVDFGARVLAAAEEQGDSRRSASWLLWQRAAAVALLAATVVIGFELRRETAPAVSPADLAGAQKLTDWRAPSDVLLETPGRQILRTAPRLGESYLQVPTKMNREE